MVCKTYKLQLIEYIYIIYLNVNKVPIIHYEDIFKSYLILILRYLKYVQNMPLFHSKLKNILLLQMFFKIYKR